MRAKLVATVSSKALRAAQFCQGKKDVRYYLNGIRIAPDGRITGTNGHVMFDTMSEYEGTLKDYIIINIDGAVPLKGDRAEVWLFDNGKDGFLEIKGPDHTSFGKKLFFEVIDGKYPDVDRITTQKREPEMISKVGIDSTYLRLVEKVFNGDGVSVSIDTANTVIKLESPTRFDNTGFMYIMPMRVPE